MKIGLTTLGCDKNTVDMEYLAGALERRGHEVAGEGPQTTLDVLVLFSCGFIDSARQESLGALMAYADSKRRTGNPRRLILAGCLAQRFGEEMAADLPDVDAFAGVGAPEALADLIEKVGGESGRPATHMAPPSMRVDHALPR